MFRIPPAILTIVPKATLEKIYQGLKRKAGTEILMQLSEQSLAKLGNAGLIHDQRYQTDPYAGMPIAGLTQMTTGKNADARL
jgi:hypothetical protein